MNKILKSLLLICATVSSYGMFVGCSDDSNGGMSRLFRPVLSNSNITSALDENKVPYLEFKWDAYSDADKYVATLVPSDGSDPITIETNEATCKFTDLAYDLEYLIKLKAISTTKGLESKEYTTSITTVDYPTMLNSLSSSNIIDTEARITWDVDGGNTIYDELKVYNGDDELIDEIQLTEADLAAGEVIVRNLEPAKSYRVDAYYNGKYLGKKRFKTTASESYSGAVVDLRVFEASELKKMITTAFIDSVVAANAEEDVNIVLKGGVEYSISGGTTIPATTKTVRFVTGLTLEGNARFTQGGGFAIGKNGADVEKIVFEKIDFISDKAKAMSDINANTDKNWGGRQVFNINGVGSILKNLTFKDCTITGYRAVVRGQTNTDNIHNVTMENCTINGIGDQGVLTNADKGGDWKTVTLKNCTFTNIVMLCDFRKTANPLEVNIQNCTFCYAPLETIANANTPLFRFGSNTVALTVKNTLFGPSMASENSSGGTIKPYTAGVAGSVMINATATTLDVISSYKTDFIYTDFGTEEASKTYPLEGVEDLKLSETELWSKPSNGNFKIIANLDATDVGDLRWY